MSPHLQ
jgi:hypothetical protein